MPRSSNIATERLNQHSNGWDVIFQGTAILHLNFLQIDPPCYLFKMARLGELGNALTEEDLTKLWDSADTIFSGFDGGICVGTDQFWACSGENDIVSIRDARPW